MRGRPCSAPLHRFEQGGRGRRSARRGIACRCREGPLPVTRERALAVTSSPEPMVESRARAKPTGRKPRAAYGAAVALAPCRSLTPDGAVSAHFPDAEADSCPFLSKIRIRMIDVSVTNGGPRIPGRMRGPPHHSPRATACIRREASRGAPMREPRGRPAPGGAGRSSLGAFTWRSCTPCRPRRRG